MEFSAQQIAQMLGGTVDGDPGSTVNQLSKIEEGTKGSLSFLANPLYTPYIYTTLASVVIVNQDFVPDNAYNCTLVRVPNAYAAFAKLLEVYNKIKLDRKGISPMAFVSASAKLGNDVYVGEFAVIEDNVVVGDNTKIYPQAYVGQNTHIGQNTTLFAGVKVYSDNVIGNNCTLHSGVVIGGDGFGFAPQDTKDYKKIAQIGNVIIEDWVEIGSNTAIDRATLGSTIIRQGVKLDNLIQIAHNVEVGNNTVIAALTGISGSTKVGANCMIGGQVGIIGHTTIADEVKIAAQSGVTNAIKEKGAIMMGSPAEEAKQFKRSYIGLRNIQKLYTKVNELENKLKALEKGQIG
jgi:UDP-3-O-[3-hydroxymyristoyl] glucosamine N-acyltransferase